MPKKPEPQPVEDTLHWATAGAPGPVRDLTGMTLGDFQVDHLLGRGGMGEVYLARQTSLNRQVALKVLRPDLLTNATYLARFESEAWAAAKLNDPNIVHIYSLGSIDGVQFIAMEYVQGTNLKDYLQKKGPPELMLALSIMRQAGNAIRAAGEMGLVHRDIKPENLMMTRKGLVKVADFGLCRDQDSERPSVTQPGVTMGTPLYMSPEQAQGMALDHRSDLYSLGVTYYHMLAGQPPFKGETPLSLALKHVKDIPVDLSVHRPDLPADLCRLVMKLMAKSPGGRYQSASEMLRDLAKVREAVVSATPASAAVGSTSPSISIADMPDMAKSATSRPAPTLVDDAPRRGGAGLTAMMVVVGLIAGSGVGWGLRPRNLLATTAKGPSGPPALWMAPDWTEVPRRPTAEGQYRHAQLQSEPGARRAAWLAVPGHHPGDKEWSGRAYTQLARLLFREGDVGYLDALAAEMAKADRAHEKALARVVRVGVEVLKGDPLGVINDFGGDFIGIITDPGLAELSLEITLVAERSSKKAALTTSASDKLKAIEYGLIRRTVNIMFRDVQGQKPSL